MSTSSLRFPLGFSTIWMRSKICELCEALPSFGALHPPKLHNQPVCLRVSNSVGESTALSGREERLQWESGLAVLDTRSHPSQNRSHPNREPAQNEKLSPTRNVCFVTTDGYPAVPVSHEPCRVPLGGENCCFWLPYVLKAQNRHCPSFACSMWLKPAIWVSINSLRSPRGCSTVCMLCNICEFCDALSLFGVMHQPDLQHATCILRRIGCHRREHRILKTSRTFAEV